MPKGGLGLFVGDRFAEKILDAGVDSENSYLWVVVATETGKLGVADVYTLHSPSERARIWRRMIEELDTSFPWIIGGDFNFVE